MSELNNIPVTPPIAPTPTLNLDTKEKITWCPGCGNFSIIAALKNALKTLNLPKESIMLVGDIGCSSKIIDYVDVNTFGSLHGRAIPLAEGIKLANHDLNVIAIGGDGGLYAEGGNHILHAARRNINITLIINDNQIYGLTKGQTSPTSDKNMVTSATPTGAIETPINPLFIALATGATFAARGYAGDLLQLTNIIKEAIIHKGFSIVDILSSCVTFNKINTLEWYREKIYNLDTETVYTKTDLTQALGKVRELNDRIPTGILYKIDQPTYEEQVVSLKNGSLVSQNTDQIDVSALLNV